MSLDDDDIIDMARNHLHGMLFHSGEMLEAHSAALPME